MKWLLDLFDPRPHRETDFSKLHFDDLPTANRAVVILWVWYKEVCWARRLLRLIWLVTFLFAIWGWVR